MVKKRGDGWYIVLKTVAFTTVEPTVCPGFREQWNKEPGQGVVVSRNPRNFRHPSKLSFSEGDCTNIRSWLHCAGYDRRDKVIGQARK